MKRFASLLYIILFFGFINSSSAQTTYYSQGSVDPTITTNWNSNPGGGGTIPSNFTSGDTFRVQLNHSMTTGNPWTVIGAVAIDSAGILTVNSNVTTDLLMVSLGGTVNVSSSMVLQINNGNGSGFDLLLNGTMNFSGTLIYNAGATGEVQTFGAFLYNIDGGTIPSFTWTGNARVTITGMISSTSIGGLNQSFREFRWNCTSQTTAVEFNSQLTSVGKNLWIQSTGSGSIVLFNSSGNLDAAYLEVDGGTVNFSTTSSVFPTVTISSSGTSFSQLGGTTIQTTGAGSKGTFVFASGDRDIRQLGSIGTGVGYHFLPGSVVGILNNQITVTGDMTIDSAAYFGYNYLSNPTNYQAFTVVGTGGNFELKKHGTFYVYHDSGLTSSGANGSVQVTGSRIFDPLANYYFWGGTQVTGIATPDTLYGNVEVWPGISLTLTKNTLINGTLTIIDVPFNIGSQTLELRGIIVDSLNSLVKGYFQSNSDGTVFYNKTITGQKIITNNSQYGNLVFNNYSKDVVAGKLSISNSFTPGASSVHNVFSDDSIEYNGSGTQTISGFSYANLLITGSRGAGNVTFESAETVFVAQSFSPSASFSGGSYITSNSFIEFNGPSAQSISALSGGIPYHHLIVDKSAGVLTAGSAITLTGNLHLLNGTFADGGNGITLNGNIGGSAGQHTSSGGGKILLTGGAAAHQINDVDLGTVEINDANGALVTAAPGIQDLILTSGAFDISTGLYILSAGSISQSSGSLAGNGSVYFNGTATVSGTIAFYNTEVNGAVDFGTASTITNMLLINSSGSVTGNAPTYVGSALLKYATGGTFPRGLEWSSFGGAGYPKNVQITNNTVLNLGFGGTDTARQLSGNLTIDTGSELSMNVGGSQMTAPLTVLGNLTINGILTASSMGGGNVIAKGDWTLNGTFNPNNQSVLFNGSSIQNISGVTTFDSLIINNSSDLNLNNSIAVASFLDFQNGNIVTNGNSVTFDSTATFSISSGYVNGNVIHTIPTGSNIARTFPIGDASYYTPVQATFATVSAPGNITASTSVAGAELTGSFIDAAKNVNRYWTLTNSGVGYDTYDATFNFNAADVDGGSNTGIFVIKRYGDAIWNEVTEGTLTSTSSQGTSINGFGEFAVGELVTYDIASSVFGNGAITPLGTTSVAHGDSQNYAINPDPGYHIDSVIVDGTNAGAVSSYDFLTVTTTHSITAYFSINSYSITTNAFGNGSVSPVSPTVNYGALQAFIFSPDPGYHVDSVLVDGVLTDSISSYTFTNVTGAHTVDAYFSINYYAITTTPFGNGNISPSSPAVPHGSSQTFTISSDAGYQLDSVLVGGMFVDSTTSYTFTNVTSAQSIAAYFSIETVPPSAPQNLIAVASNGQIQIHWNPNTDTDFLKYFIYRDTIASPTTLVDSTSLIDDTLKTYSGLTNGRTYYFTVAAKDTNGNISGVSNEVSTAPIGLIAFYPFSGNANDAGGNVYHAVVNGAVLTLDRFGNANSSYNLNGSTDYLTTTGIDLPQGNSERTISAFFKWNNGSGGNDLYVAGWGNSFILNSGFHLNIYNGNYRFVGFSNDITSSAVTPNVWHQFTAALKNDSVSIYIDGSFVTKEQKILNTISTDTLYFGMVRKEGSTPINPFSGSIDDIRVYNRALSASEISTFYQEGGWPAPDAPTNLAATATDGQIQIHWNPNTESDFEKYYIYRGTSPNPTVVIDSTSAIDDTLKTYTGLTNYTTYYFRIAAKDTSGNVGLYSNEVAAMPTDQTPPLSPTGLIATSGNHEILLQWNKNTETDFAKYFIYRDTAASPTTLVDSIIAATDTTKIFSSLVNGQAYYFRLKAQDTSGNTSGYSSQVTAIPVGLIASYPFPGNANDISGNENHGTVNGALLIPDRFGNLNNAYGFDGTIQNIEINSSNSLNPSALSISSWIYIDSISPTARVILRKNRDGGVGQGEQYSIYTIGNEIMWNSQDLTPFNITTSGANLQANAWYHIILTYDNDSNVVKIFLNGLLIDVETNVIGNIASSSTPLNIGSHPHYGDLYSWLGKLDDIRIYNRVISSSEIDSLYQLNGWNPLSVPQNLAANAVDGQINLIWNQTSGARFKQYYIYGGTTANPVTRIDSTFDINDTTISITGLSNYTTYYFRISAIDSADNESFYSNEATEMPIDLTPPTAPQNVYITALDSAVQIGWDPVAATDFNRYYIYGGTTPGPTTIIDTLFTVTDSLQTITGLSNYTT
ncbi:MAG: LamG-like jellyroll fold domain-containing protein, partial [Bacteroidota bacterium]